MAEGLSRLAFFFVSVWVPVLYFCSFAPAKAATEFCPATVNDVAAIGSSSDGPSRTYEYELEALTPRSVSATIVADTEAGWYLWHVADVALEEVHRALPYRDLVAHYSVAASRPLAVAFPEALTIRHAWVLSAIAHGDSTMGWDKRGSVVCPVPAFSAASDAEEASQAPRPAPAVSPSPAAPQGVPVPSQAVSGPAPFEAGHCDKPFRAASVIAVGAAESQDLSNRAIGIVRHAVAYVALDGNGKVLDVWMFSGSGWAPYDLGLMRDARLSSFSGAVSYCQHVPSRYLFTTWVP